MAVEERDHHSGYLTTGHDWNGITELNRPVPKVIWLFLLVTFLSALILWILLPAWPLGTTFTRGLLGIDERAAIAENLADAAAARADWADRVAALSFEEIDADPALSRAAVETGRTLFGDNCAMCHGSAGLGGPGFPSLADRAWLWGGDRDAILETLRVGINSGHPDSRSSQMLAFGRDGILDRRSLLDVAAFVQSLSDPAVAQGAEADAVTAGAAVFAENCASCHGDAGKGGLEFGAPDLTDGFWIYGGDRQSIVTTLQQGRMGVMPAWEGRLSETDRGILAYYVHHLGSGAK
ncbi:cytochrome-c oxidase, cbb3-type subunit III [Oceanibacterium hippocampi]|uniref:Cbb3-type cytochrome c oxidase subunit n=1 Tax=Oceanibacterium hippocampi TaxID=745714 RepID=A0A1Y5SAX4_9PROT|nr:cytochrome-c oxidase, cbb3-type subunit III [Oceanibacterium hippocampi]SLN36233.1 Cbb3-type cytochrome c oxidase subunit FixP [Oceanibacterium hippocampi]